MFTIDEKERYARQFALPGFGSEGQRRLREASVLIVGAGGLGSPLAVYLAAAGIGRIGIIDADAVDRSNLHRQVLFSEKDLGALKVDRARERMRSINPGVGVEPIADRLTSDNALDIFRRYDIIADGTDNFATRYLVNDAAVLTGRPVVYGSVFRFEGQVTVLHHNGGPCYRCLFPEPPPAGTVPNCAEGGVLGVMPGIIGSLQSLEVIKLAAGIGTPLAGRLLTHDGLSGTSRTIAFERDPSCPVCGDSPTIDALIDYEAFCGVGEDADVPEIEVEELSDRLSRNGGAPFILDVREPFEREIASIGGSLIPLGELASRIDELPADRDIVVVCRSGGRSARATEELRRRGFGRVVNLRGGLQKWRQRIDDSMADY